MSKGGVGPVVVMAPFESYGLTTTTLGGDGITVTQRCNGCLETMVMVSSKAKVVAGVQWNVFRHEDGCPVLDCLVAATKKTTVKRLKKLLRIAQAHINKIGNASNN